MPDTRHDPRAKQPVKRRKTDGQHQPPNLGDSPPVASVLDATASAKSASAVVFARGGTVTPAQHDALATRLDALEKKTEAQIDELRRLIAQQAAELTSLRADLKERRAPAPAQSPVSSMSLAPIQPPLPPPPLPSPASSPPPKAQTAPIPPSARPSPSPSVPARPLLPRPQSVSRSLSPAGLRRSAIDALMERIIAEEEAALAGSGDEATPAPEDPPTPRNDYDDPLHPLAPQQQDQPRYYGPATGPPPKPLPRTPSPVMSSPGLPSPGLPRTPPVLPPSPLPCSDESDDAEEVHLSPRPFPSPSASHKVEEVDVAGPDDRSWHGMYDVGAEGPSLDDVANINVREGVFFEGSDGERDNRPISPTLHAASPTVSASPSVPQPTASHAPSPVARLPALAFSTGRAKIAAWQRSHPVEHAALFARHQASNLVAGPTPPRIIDTAPARVIARGRGRGRGRGARGTARGAPTSGPARARGSGRTGASEEDEDAAEEETSGTASDYEDAPTDDNASQNLPTSMPRRRSARRSSARRKSMREEDSTDGEGCAEY